MELGSEQQVLKRPLIGVSSSSSSPSKGKLRRPRGGEAAPEQAACDLFSPGVLAVTVSLPVFVLTFLTLVALQLPAGDSYLSRRAALGLREASKLAGLGFPFLGYCVFSVAPPPRLRSGGGSDVLKKTCKVALKGVWLALVWGAWSTFIAWPAFAAAGAPLRWRVLGLYAPLGVEAAAAAPCGAALFGGGGGLRGRAAVALWCVAVAWPRRAAAAALRAVAGARLVEFAPRAVDHIVVVGPSPVVKGDLDAVVAAQRVRRTIHVARPPHGEQNTCSGRGCCLLSRGATLAALRTKTSSKHLRDDELVLTLRATRAPAPLSQDALAAAYDFLCGVAKQDPLGRVLVHADDLRLGARVAVAWLCASARFDVDGAVATVEQKVGFSLDALYRDAGLRQFAEHLRERDLDGWALIDRDDV